MEGTPFLPAQRALHELDRGVEPHPFRGQDGTTFTLQGPLFSTVPGCAAYVVTAHHHTLNLPQYGVMWSFIDHNAIQAGYRITHQVQECRPPDPHQPPHRGGD